MVVELLKEARDFLDAAKLDLEDRRPSDARKEGGQHIETCRKLIETLGKLEGQMNGGTTINIINNPMWLQIQQIAIKATKGYPEVRKKIANAFDNIQESS